MELSENNDDDILYCWRILILTVFENTWILYMDQYTNKCYEIKFCVNLIFSGFIFSFAYSTIVCFLQNLWRVQHFVKSEDEFVPITMNNIVYKKTFQLLYFFELVFLRLSKVGVPCRLILNSCRVTQKSQRMRLQCHKNSVNMNIWRFSWYSLFCL